MMACIAYSKVIDITISASTTKTSTAIKGNVSIEYQSTQKVTFEIFTRWTYCI